MKPLRHNGGNCPVHPETEVRVKWAGLPDHALGWSRDEIAAGKLIWAKRGWAHDIVGYLVTKEADDAR